MATTMPTSQAATFWPPDEVKTAQMTPSNQCSSHMCLQRQVLGARIASADIHLLFLTDRLNRL
jgi:hypothetical protein